MEVKETVLQDEIKFTKVKVDYHLDEGATFITVNKIKKLLPKIDKVTRVIHYRNSDTGRYVTYILGIRGAIREEGTLSSGFGGVGVQGLRDVLVECGFDKEEVWSELTKKSEGITKIEFIK